MILPRFDFRFDLGGGWEISGIVEAADKAGAIIKAQALLIERFPSLREDIVTAPQSAFSAEITSWHPEHSQLNRGAKISRRYEEHKK